MNMSVYFDATMMFVFYCLSSSSCQGYSDIILKILFNSYLKGPKELKMSSKIHY